MGYNGLENVFLFCHYLLKVIEITVEPIVIINLQIYKKMGMTQ